jgi:signal transduction histidine kinase
VSQGGERYSRELRALATLDTELDELVLEARSGLLTDYDPLVEVLREMRQIGRRAATTPAYLDAAASADLAARLAESDKAVAAKEGLIERFKSENSVLRNSTRFFPIEASRLSTAPGTGELAAEIGALATDVLLYNVVSDRAIAKRVDEDAANLEKRARAVGRGGDVELLLSHARVILERRPVVDELTTLIVKGSSPRKLGLDAAFARHEERALARVARAQLLALAAALLTVVLVAVDIITRQRRSAEALRVAGDRLQSALADLHKERERERELVELKSRFVSVTSHEFRTPLSVILSSTELLEAYADRWSTERKKEHFDRVGNAVRGMVRLLDDMLMIGKADAGKLEFHPAALDVGALCADVASEVQQSAGTRYHVEYAAKDKLERAMMDEKLLRPILVNLLSNAVKYSPEGGAVRLVVARQGDEAVFEVSDEGIGIPANDLSRLFDAFHRGTNVAKIAGTGLGLAIVKRSVDVCGGTIDVESHVGKGTRFTVRLPCGEQA